MRKLGTGLILSLLIVAWASLPAATRAADTATGKDVTVTVTVERHGPNAPAALHADDVFVRQNHQRRPVVRWVKATEANKGLDMAVLIDDSLDPAIGNHYSELKDFIRSLPAGSKVAIAYAMNGEAKFTQDFTANHERAVKAIRITQGRLNQTSSIYMAYNSLLKHWPKDGNRRAVLLLTDGIDLYWGVTDALPTNNPDLQRAVAQAQREGVTTYAIYADTAGGIRRNAFLVNVGQSCLSMLSLATGGKTYTQGLQTPIDFQWIFRNLKERLGNQYLLTFRAQPGNKAAYERLHLTTEQPDVELVAPSRVYVPAASSG